jgi:hypothetical protein
MMTIQRRAISARKKATANASEARRQAEFYQEYCDAGRGGCGHGAVSGHEGADGKPGPCKITGCNCPRMIRPPAPPVPF